MKLYGNENNEAIMKELGARIRDTRIAMNMTQAQLAEESGLALLTVSRSERGESVQFSSLLNILRVLGLLENVDLLVQEQELAPTEIVDRGTKRKRASSKRKADEGTEWVWGDEK